MVSPTLQRLGRYILVEPLGQGGMGQVWLAYLLGTNGVKSPCAIKLLPAQKDEPEHIKLLRQEAKLSSQLRHNSLGSFYEFASANELSYLVMEHIEGITLLRIVVDSEVSEKPLPLEFTLYIAIQIASGLDYLHRFQDPESGTVAEVVHGDLTPQNIMVNFEGEVKIIDLGLARMHFESPDHSLDMHYGNILYTSPNRIKSRRISPSDDIFGLGVILWELFCGRRYYEEKKIEAIYEELKDFTPRDPKKINPNLPDSVAQLILGCLESESFNGYATVSELLADLQRELVRVAPTFVPADFREFICNEYAPELFTSKSRRMRDLNLLSSFENHVEKAKTSGAAIIEPPTFKFAPKGTGEIGRDGNTEALPTKGMINGAPKAHPKPKPQAPLTNATAANKPVSIDQMKELPKVGELKRRPPSSFNSVIAVMIAGVLVVGAFLFAKIYSRADSKKSKPLDFVSTETRRVAPVESKLLPPAPLTEEGRIAPPEAREVMIKSEPEGAHIWLNGQPLKIYTPAKLRIDSERAATIKLTYKGMPTFSILLDASKRALSVDMEFNAYTTE